MLTKHYLSKLIKPKDSYFTKTEIYSKGNNKSIIENLLSSENKTIVIRVELIWNRNKNKTSAQFKERTLNFFSFLVGTVHILTKLYLTKPNYKI